MKTSKRALALAATGLVIASTASTFLWLALRNSDAAVEPAIVSKHEIKQRSEGNPARTIETGEQTEKVDLPTPNHAKDRLAQQDQTASETDNRPLDLQIADYKAAADAGDMDAACRLLDVIDDCSSTLGSNQIDDASLIGLVAGSNLSEEEFEGASKQLAITLERRRLMTEECQRVPTRTRQTTLPYLFDLANDGDTAAMLRFATGPTTAEAMFSQQSIELYRQHGWDIFQRAFEAGEPGAVLLWVNAIEYPGMSLAAVLPDDWKNRDVALAMEQRIQSEVERHASQDRGEFKPEATARAETLFQRYFATSPATNRWAQQQRERREKYEQQPSNISSFVDQLINSKKNRSSACTIDNPYDSP